MDTELVAGLIGGIVGIVMAVVAMVAVRQSEGRHSEAALDVPDPVPSGVASVLSVLPSSAVVLDAEDRVLRASTAARAYGLVRGDALVVAELLAMARQVRRDGEIRETAVDVAGQRFGQDSTSFAVRVAPLGTKGLVLVLAEDQTESRRVEAVRRDFVANVSHELKTPVGALSLLAEAIESAADDPDAVRRFTGRMQLEASRLNNLVKDLITLGRIQGGAPVPDPHPLVIGEVVTDAISFSELKASSKNISLVPAGPMDVRVWGDEDLLITALRNLIDNAVAYSPEDTRVVVTVKPAPDRVEISVTDQGIGVPEHAQERIFERFFRVDPARSRQTGGTGLGLAIVKHVAVAHGGEVTVWSKEGSGSTFTLRLPALGVADAVRQLGGTHSPPGAAVNAAAPSSQEAVH